MNAARLFFLVLFLPVLLSGQENWLKYGNGPVLRRDTTYFPPSNDLYAISDCWVLKDGALFKMWYTCGGGNYPADTLLRSRICYCESNDGINWNKYVNNPVLDVDYNGSWDSLGVETISVLIDSSAPPAQRYKAWYCGQTVNAYQYDVGYAYSPDGVNWTKHPSRVMAVGASGDWDNAFIEGSSVIKEGSTYKMWYAALDLVFDGQPTDGKVNIGYATSPDGISWTKYAGNPVLVTGTNAWDSIYVQDPHVIKYNGVYQLWYGGCDRFNNFGQQVGYASSADGINWTKSPLNPVLQRGASGMWDENTASFPSVMLDNNVLKMWYTGKNVDPLPPSLNYFWEIGYATDSTLTAIAPQQELKSPVSVFPNPSDGQFRVSFAAPVAVFTITDIRGKKVAAGTLQRSPEMLDLRALQPGVYFLRINGSSNVVKLIITA